MSRNKVGSAVAASLAMMVWAGSAFAGVYCVDGAACKATEACHGGLCVPKDRLCKDTTGCKAWQVCDMTCPGAPSVGGGGGGDQTGCASSDGDACSSEATWPDAVSSSDGGSSGAMPEMDGGSGAPFQGDTGSGEKKMPPDASSDPMPDVGVGTPDMMQPAPCPKDQGVCVADLKKVPIQPACKAFCAAVVTCKFMDGGTSSVGPVPPPPGDADGSNGFAPPADAQSMPAYDAGSGDQAMPMDAASSPDANFAAKDTYQGGQDSATAVDAGDPQAGEVAQCELICSVWKLENVAAPELTALEQCVAAHYANPKSCTDMNAACQANGDAFQKAATADDIWMLGLGGTTETTGSTKNDGDAMGSSDTTTGSSPVGADAGSDVKTTASDTASSAAAGSSAAKSSTGCTASPAGANSPWALSLLGLVGLALVWLRRRASV